MDFTTEYIDMPVLIATQSNKPFIDHIEQIHDKKIAVVKHYVIGDILKKRYPNINLVEVDSVSEGLRDVESGKIFALVDNLATINYEIQNNFINSVKVSGRLDIRIKYRMATRNDEPILHEIFEKIITSIDGTVKKEIFKKWIHSYSTEETVDFTIIWYILGAVSVMIALSSYRQYSLNKLNRILHQAVKEKTKDLQKSNENLELKIQKEVLKNLRTQEQLFKSEKMASMGEMIGNIAHQWRQPLSVISTASTGMLMQKEYGVLEDKAFKKGCEAINENAQYLSKTIEDFKNFIKGDREKKHFYLHSEIESFLHLMDSSIKRHALKVIVDVDDDIQIIGYQNELLQSLINIFNNAKDALEETQIESKIILLSCSLEDQKVTIELQDNAGGISTNILPKVFDPYFTTKHKKQGTGLGLSMVYSLIVEGMNGTVEAKNNTFIYENTEYTGALFTITIPQN